MKRILALVAFIITVISVNAQTTTTHTVQRGETIESVAQKYGVTVQDLQNANPDTKEYFYIGMKLSIPAVKKTATPSSPKVTTPTQKQSGVVNGGSDFSSAGIYVGHDFSKVVGVTYGVQGQYFLKNGLGATMTFGGNWGIESDADMVLRLGPSYVYPINDLFYVMGTAAYTLTIANHNGNSSTISGFSIIPTFGVSLNHFKIGLNGDFHWRNGGSFGSGLYLSAAYSF